LEKRCAPDQKRGAERRSNAWHRARGGPRRVPDQKDARNRARFDLSSGALSDFLSGTMPAESTSTPAPPFILLNLAFSLQAAYAAPLILLAQTRQADRDNINVKADAEHREALAQENLERQAINAERTAQLLELVKQNTQLTEITKDLSNRIEELTAQIHQRLVAKDAA
jgi:hypothetical protein